MPGMQGRESQLVSRTHKRSRPCGMLNPVLFSGDGMNWIKLTSAKTKREILINIERGLAVNAHAPTMSGAVEGSVISFGTAEVVVTETPEEIEAILHPAQVKPSEAELVVMALNKLSDKLLKLTDRPDRTKRQ